MITLNVNLSQRGKGHSRPALQWLQAVANKIESSKDNQVTLLDYYGQAMCKVSKSIVWTSRSGKKHINIKPILDSVDKYRIQSGSSKHATFYVELNEFIPLIHQNELERAGISG